MSECFNKHYIYNSSVKSCEDFDESLLNKGKSLYEVIRVIDGKPLFFQRHIKRLFNSAKITNLSLWMSEEEIKNNIRKLIDINNVNIGNVKIIFNFNGNKNSFAVYFVKHHYPSKQSYINGVRTILYHGERHNPNAKVINMDFRTIVNEKIKESSAFEAILVDRSGYITEGSKSNLFMVKNNAVLTAPLEDVLPGVTRDVIIDLCKEDNIEICEEKVNYKDLDNIEALFISGTSPKVLPINSVDGMSFNSARDETILKIIKAYDRAVEKDILNYK